MKAYFRICMILFSFFQIKMGASQSNVQREQINNPFIQEWIIEERFDRIAVSGCITLHLLTGENQSVRIQAEKNLLKYVTMEVSNGLLQIHVAPRIVHSNKILARIELPTIRSIKADRNSIVYALNAVKSEHLYVRSSRKSQMYISSITKHLYLESSHASQLFIKGKTNTYTAKSRKGSTIDIRDLEYDFNTNTDNELDLTIPLSPQNISELVLSCYYLLQNPLLSPNFNFSLKQNNSRRVQFQKSLESKLSNKKFDQWAG